MKFGKPKQKTLVELVKELEILAPDEVDMLKYQALKMGYDNGLKLDKEVYRAEINKYITFYRNKNE